MDLEWMVREAASGRPDARGEGGSTAGAMGQRNLLWRPRQRQRLWHEEWGLYRDGIVDISCSERAEWK